MQAKPRSHASGLSHLPLNAKCPETVQSLRTLFYMYDYQTVKNLWFASKTPCGFNS